MMRKKEIEEKIKGILDSKKEILFAYLYGSFVTSRNFRDIDVVVYLRDNRQPFKFCVDLKMKLSKILDISPDIFDLKVLNDVLEKPDAFTLLYLNRLLSEGKLILNRDSESLTNFLERYSNKYREAGPILREVLK